MVSSYQATHHLLHLDYMNPTSAPTSEPPGCAEVHQPALCVDCSTPSTKVCESFRNTTPVVLYAVIQTGPVCTGRRVRRHFQQKSGHMGTGRMIVKLQPTFLNLQVRNLCCRSSTGPGRSAARPPTWQDDCKTAAHYLKLTSTERLLQIVNGPGPISGMPTNMAG